MRVWTNGSLHLARTPRGLYLFRGTQLLRRLEAPAVTLGGEVLFTVSPSGTLAWLDGLRRLLIEEATVEEQRFDNNEPILDLVSLDEERLAVVFGAGRGRPARLAVGVPGQRWELELPLEPSVPPPHAIFPVATAWQQSTPLPWSPSPSSLAEGLRQVRLHTGAHGLAVACRCSGLVGVLPPGAGALWWLRLPWQNEVALDAVATEAGVLVTLVVAGGEGVTAQFDRSGVCLGHSGPTRQSVGAVLLTGGRFVLFDDSKSQARVKVLDVGDCRDLHPRARLSLARPPQDAASSPDGRWAIFGAPSATASTSAAASAVVTIFELGDKRLAQVATFDPDEALRESEVRARDKARIEQGAQYRRAEGGPSLGFPVSKAPVVPWETLVGETLELSLSLRSTGGPGTGVVVELSGPAIAEGLVEPLSVAVAGQRVTPLRSATSWNAPIKDVEIPRGMIFPFDPKPKSPEQSEKAQGILATTHLDLHLRLATSRVGTALLTIAARTLSGSAAAMKWTRPVNVREPGEVTRPGSESDADPTSGSSHQSPAAGVSVGEPSVNG